MKREVLMKLFNVKAALILGIAVLAAAGPWVYRWGWRAYQVRAEVDAPPEDMVMVPAGLFFMGSDDPAADADEGPMRSYFLPAFYIDTHEVTNAAFKRFDPKHTYPAGQDDYPVTGITLAQARAYAASIGKRLPTKAEWEKAARGTDGRAYTWGNEFKDGVANVCGTALEPVGSHPESASPYGAQDMIGNAWEWVEDTHRDRSVFGTQASEHEVIKGGGYSYNAYQSRASYNGFEGLGGTCNDVGFRCAKDATRR